MILIDTDRLEFFRRIIFRNNFNDHLAVCQNLVPLVLIHTHLGVFFQPVFNARFQPLAWPKLPPDTGTLVHVAALHATSLVGRPKPVVSPPKKSQFGAHWGATHIYIYIHIYVYIYIYMYIYICIYIYVYTRSTCQMFPIIEVNWMSIGFGCRTSIEAKGLANPRQQRSSVCSPSQQLALSSVRSSS